MTQTGEAAFLSTGSAAPSEADFLRAAAVKSREAAFLSTGSTAPNKAGFL